MATTCQKQKVGWKAPYVPRLQQEIAFPVSNDVIEGRLLNLEKTGLSAIGFIGVGGHETGIGPTMELKVIASWKAQPGSTLE